MSLSRTYNFCLFRLLVEARASYSEAEFYCLAELWPITRRIFLHILVIKIRGFCNTDIYAICELWNTHHADVPGTQEMNPLRLELSCLAKPYFEPSQLLIAEEDLGTPLGFIHFGPVAAQNGDDVEQNANAIHALCVRPDAREAEVAGLLLSQLKLSGEQRAVAFRPTLPNAAYYLGVAPADAISGVIAEEYRLCNWLSAAGFAPGTPTCLWELQLAFFQPPVDRNQIQIRRSCQVESNEDAELPWWHACVLGHAEPATFELRRKADRQLLTSSLFWSLAAEMQDPTQSAYWWWPKFTPEDNVNTNQRLHLLAESLRALQQSGVDVVRTSTFVEDSEQADILHRLGFSPASNGMLFSKPQDES
ncbi:MAG: hypothetical protein VXZ82_06180 [Planctomycetota bacterium]|nr:hypothetical protein [Planctomycetota bacterium]